MHIILPMPRIMQDIAGASWLWITGHTRIIGWLKDLQLLHCFFILRIALDSHRRQCDLQQWQYCQKTKIKQVHAETTTTITFHLPKVVFSSLYSLEASILLQHKCIKFNISFSTANPMPKYIGRSVLYGYYITYFPILLTVMIKKEL